MRAIFQVYVQAPGGLYLEGLIFGILRHEATLARALYGQCIVELSFLMICKQIKPSFEVYGCKACFSPLSSEEICNYSRLSPGAGEGGVPRLSEISYTYDPPIYDITSGSRQNRAATLQPDVMS